MLTESRLANQNPRRLLDMVLRISAVLSALSMCITTCRFEFPLELDMWKYTVEGLAERDASAEAAAASAGRPDAPAPGEAGAARPGTPKAGAHGLQYMYQLKGVVVHSGTANVGHYYSYIKVGQLSRLPLHS